MPVIRGPHVISVHTRFRLPARFATNNGIDQEITVEMVNPGPRQTWFIQPTEKHGYYTITAGATPPHPGAPGFRRDIDRGPQDVLNARLPGEWLIVPVGGLDDVFQVHPFNVIIGVEELLGTEGDKVVIQTFPIGVPREDLPFWNITPVLD